MVTVAVRVTGGGVVVVVVTDDRDGVGDQVTCASPDAGSENEQPPLAWGAREVPMRAAQVPGEGDRGAAVDLVDDRRQHDRLVREVRDAHRVMVTSPPGSGTDPRSADLVTAIDGQRVRDGHRRGSAPPSWCCHRRRRPTRSRCRGPRRPRPR